MVILVFLINFRINIWKPQRDNSTSNSEAQLFTQAPGTPRSEEPCFEKKVENIFNGDLPFCFW